jgi:hypothetical protein
MFMPILSTTPPFLSLKYSEHRRNSRMHTAHLGLTHSGHARRTCWLPTFQTLAFQFRLLAPEDTLIGPSKPRPSLHDTA